jgi:F-type H+-transporting ATPase subunit delta
MATLDRQADALARIYARSLFELAESEGGQDVIENSYAELEDVVELATEDPRFAEFLTSQILGVNERAKSIDAIFKNRASALTVKFLQVLNEKGRLGHLGAIVTAFDELMQEKFGRIEVDVYTAAPIDQSQLDSIKQRLRDLLNKEPIMHPYTDASMLGGLKLRIGDQLVDASVSTQLRRIQERLSREGAAQIRERVRTIIDESTNN